MNIIIALIGPSGSGKTHVGQLLQKHGIPEIVSYTTRQPRVGEIPDVSYHFVNEGEFVAIDKVEEVTYAGAKYGTARADVENPNKRIQYIVVTIDGMQAIQKACRNTRVISVFIDCPRDVCIQRMKERGDSESSITSRISNYDSSNEFHNREKCEFIFNNAGCVDEELERLLSYVRRQG